MRQIVAVVLFLSLASCKQQGPTTTGAPSEQSGRAALGECLSTKGLVLYGASWCQYCRKQERVLGELSGLVKHVSCDDPNDPNVAPGCVDAEGSYCYPTWVFQDGKRECGLLTLSELAERAGCPYKD